MDLHSIDPQDENLVGLSTRCRPFEGLTSDVIKLVYERCVEKKFQPGDTLMRQGDRGDCLMVLLDGDASASTLSLKGERSRIATLGAFDVVGEMALLTGQPRSVDVIADSNIRALVLDANEFQLLANQHPEVGMVLTHLMAERLGDRTVDALGGKFIDRYRVVCCVGRGAMAVVYKARESQGPDSVALKMMNHRLVYEPGALARFEREADLLQKLHHQNIARVDRRFSAFRTSFIVMEFCDGPVLSQVVEDKGCVPESEVRHVVGQIAGALQYMHSEGIIHRDIKPSNLMSTHGGDIKLTDFGLAKPTVVGPAAAITNSSALLGTPLYMAPEQISGEEASQASDVYALGCLTYELLTGKSPFQRRKFFELVQDKLEFSVPGRDEIGGGISKEMHGFLEACMARDKDQRDVDLDRVAGWAAPLDPAFLN